MSQCRQPLSEIGVEFGQFAGRRANSTGVQGVAGCVDVELTHGGVGDAKVALLQGDDLGVIASIGMSAAR